MKWFVEAFKNAFNFGGRARRKEYWMFTLFATLISFVLGIIDYSLGFTIGTDVGILSTLFGVALIVPGISVTIRRLHDIGRSGWWLLISIVPFFGVLVLFVFTLLDSEQGPNRFGENPKQEVKAIPSFQ